MNVGGVIAKPKGPKKIIVLDPEEWEDLAKTFAKWGIDYGLDLR